MKNLIKKLAVGSVGVASVLAVTPALATTYFTFPSPASTSAGIAPYSIEIFDSFTPVVYISVGIMVGALAIALVIRKFSGGARMVLGGRRGRGRRRGR